MTHAGKTKRNEETLSLVHVTHHCMTKQGVNCVVRLAFSTDHGVRSTHATLATWIQNFLSATC